MDNQLQIGQDFSLPYEAITQTFAILAKRGVGKTYTASVFVEEMLKAGLPVCVVDPTGAWWGLRASADGQHTGLPIAVLGGDHGDMPLTVDMAEGVAKLLAETQTPMVIDLSLFTGGETAKFMTGFGETLYRLNRNPLHLVLDEADAFAPQRIMPEQARMAGAIDKIVRRGRLRGLGITMITQRPAVLNKDILTQIEVLIAMRITAPHDSKAIDSWIEQHGTPEQRAELMNSLPSLPIGTAWIWSPGWLDTFQKVAIRQRETFNSSATPKVGEVIQQPRRLAAIDLEVLRQQLSSELEKVEANDIEALQRKVQELQRQLRDKPKPQIEMVKVPIIHEEQISELKALAAQMIEQAQALMAFGQDILAVIARSQPQAIQHPRPIVPAATTVEPTEPESDVELSGELKAGEITILKAIARRHPTQLTLSEIATLSGRSIKSSSFQGAISTMKRLGYISGGRSGLGMTEVGLNYLGDDIPSQPQTTAELLAMWQGALQPGAYRILDILVEAYPNALSKMEISARSGYSLTSSSFQGNLSLLRRNGLITLRGLAIIASPTLFIDAKVR